MGEFDHIYLSHPFTMMVSGPTSSGKTVFVRRILKNHNVLMRNIQKPLLSVAWCYGQWQKCYNEEVDNTKISYSSGLLSKTEIESTDIDVLIIDDLMSELANSTLLAELFTRGSHHNNLSVIFITQNIFHQGSKMRDIHLSCQYLILMNNPRDKSQIDYLVKQMKMKRQLVFAYNDATSKPYGYLFIDFKQQTPRSQMLKSRLTPEESIEEKFEPIIYVVAD
ncbi:hypothetical protein B4U80_10260 [Leptotrombidium deliense]|uniref:Uncharacterized protein n=1 Tax=Leptotrombidium deliense TaxID=299467 RepID=A0A443S642_9ACAR|nr:hypothetical protein B4U80_10260 [Leptotrombidium deliense]